MCLDAHPQFEEFNPLLVFFFAKYVFFILWGVFNMFVFMHYFYS